MRRNGFLSATIAALSIFGIALTGCGNKSGDSTGKLKVGDVAQAKQFVSQNYANFIQGSPARLIGCADGYSNDGCFGTTWDKDNLFYDHENGMTLFLDATDDPSKIKTASGDPYVSAEMRTSMSYQYGFFGTYMKPSNVTGTASTFFLYAGNPHDEIDIEFLGKDTTKVQFNYFKNDQGGNEYWYDLGFDASLEYHHYGFYWGENELCWYVDFKPVYRLVGTETPTAKCQLMCNHWAGSTNDKGIIAWMGEVDIDELPSLSCYKDLQIADKDGKALQVVPKMNDYNLCPEDSKLTSKPVNFKGVTGYTVADKTSTTSFEISYKKEDLTKNYQNVQFTVDGIADKKWVQFKIKNVYEDADSDYPALCRLTVDTYSSGSGTNMNQFLSAWKNGQTSSSINLYNGNKEAHYELARGEEAIMTFRWYGEGANQLTMMFDDFGTCQVKDGHGQRNGHILVSDFKFGGEQDFVPVDNSGYVDELYTPNGEIEDPETDQAEIPTGFTKLANLKPGATEYYQTSASDEGVLLEYHQLAGDDGYKECGYYGSNIFNDATEIIIVMKNNYHKQVEWQLKLKGTAENSYMVDQTAGVEILSDSSTGKFNRWSSSHTGIPYLYIAGGRTCQYKFTLTGQVKAICYVMNIAGKTELTSSALIKGIYARVHTHTFADAWSTSPTEHWHAATCEHTDEKSGLAAHEFGAWTEVTPATETADGLEARTCSVCGYKEERAIPALSHVHTYEEGWTTSATEHWHASTCGHDVKDAVGAHTFTEWTANGDLLERECTVCGYKETKDNIQKDIKVNYGWKSANDYVVSEDDSGIHVSAPADSGGGYTRLDSNGSFKVDNAEEYIFVIKNTGDTKVELRMALRNHTTKTYANSTNVSDYSIESKNNNSDTKITEFKSDFIRFRIGAGDIATFHLAVASDDYDQLNLMAKHDTDSVSFMVIKTDVVVANHNWEPGWHKDETHHWKACTDENCTAISQKAEHTWVSDPDHTDIPATETEDGTEYKVCSVCGQTKEVTIPHGSSGTGKQIDVNYHFGTYQDYTVSEDANGINFAVAANSSKGYDGLYLDMSTSKVANASEYSFVIKNNGTERIELRFGYRDTSVQPRIFANSSDASAYTIESELSSSNTKIREVKDGYLKINIAAGDTATIHIPMTTDAFDQFVFIVVHTSAASLTIIKTGYTVANS